MEYMAAAIASITLLEKLIPIIQSAVNNGEITAQQQAELKAKIDSIRSGAAFAGPEWKVSTDA